MGILQAVDPLELPESHDWHYTPIAACVNRGPYLIGAPPLGFDTHHPFRKTLPCYRSLRGCTLTCPRCRFKLAYTCYVPLLDLSQCRKFRIVITGAKKTWGDVKDLPVGTVVYLNRGKLTLDTIRVRADGSKLDPLQEKVWLKRCQDDISPYLFHLWQLRELTEHFGQTYYPSRRVLENDAANAPNPDRPDGTTIE